MEYTLEQLKEQISSFPVSNNGRRIGMTNPFRQAVVLAFEKSELTSIEFASQIGIGLSSLKKWIHDFRSHPPSQNRRKSEAQFRKIEVTHSQERAHEIKKAFFTIEGPQGLRISGISLSELSQLWRELC